MHRRRLLISVIAVLAVIIAAFATLATCHYFLLMKPSLQGKCRGLTLNSPAPTRPHLLRFRGEVVGKNLEVLQYRWLRRRFKAVGTTLSLVRDLPSTEYEGNLVLHGERVGNVVIDNSGSFDFGDLPPGEYDLTVIYPGEDAVGFGFVIDTSAPNADVLIDASPAYYCNCCGWNFEVNIEQFQTSIGKRIGIWPVPASGHQTAQGSATSFITSRSNC